MPKKRKPISSRQKPPRGGLPGWAWLAGGAALLVLLVGGLLYLGYGSGPAAVAADGDIDGVKILADPGRGHQDGDIAYNDLVPAGGLHNPEWLNCGIYDAPVRNENVIHSLEHGAVWIAYRPELPAEEVNSLRELVRDEQRRLGERMIVLAPKPGLQTPIIATAWRVQLELENAGDERLDQFVQRYQRGPFYPEPGATCTFGGVGEPLS